MAILAAAVAMGPDLGISSSAGGHDPYEVNLKIMIAAIVVLFSVILFILGLHLYAKWFWRSSQFGRQRQQASLRFHDDDDPMLSNPAFGLDKAFLEALPTFVFHDTQDSDDKIPVKIPDCCAVCISEFQDGETGRLLPKCGHAFHTECIDMWLHCHTTCPLCRTPIISLPWEARAKAEPVALDLVFLDPSILEEAAAAAAAAATAAAEVAGSPRPSEQNPSSSVASDGLKPQDAQWGQLVIHIPQLSDGSSSSTSSSSSSSAPKSPKSRWRNLRRMLSRDRDRDRKVVPSSVQSSPPHDVDHPGSSLD